MSSVTMAQLKVVSKTESEILIAMTTTENPVRIPVRSYESGVILQIPWCYRSQLGEPNYEALKRIVRTHFDGLIQTRTQTDPRFARAAKARASSEPDRSARETQLQSNPA